MKKGQGYIEIMVVITVSLIILSFAVPNYLDIAEKAHVAKIANDSKLVEAYVLEEYFLTRQMPRNSKQIDDIELKNIANNFKVYHYTEELNHYKLQAIRGVKYKLDKAEVLQTVNTKLKGDFIYTDKGVIYIDNVKNKNTDDLPLLTGTAKPEHVLSGETFANKDNINLIGTMPNHGKFNKKITRTGEVYKLLEGYYEGGEIKVDIPSKGNLNKEIKNSGKLSLDEGYYDKGSITVKNLKPTNIKKGVEVGGIKGTFDPTNDLKIMHKYEANSMDSSYVSVKFDDIGGKDKVVAILATGFKGGRSIEHYQFGVTPFTKEEGSNIGGTRERRINITDKYVSVSLYNGGGYADTTANIFIIYKE